MKFSRRISLSLYFLSILEFLCWNSCGYATVISESIPQLYIEREKDNLSSAPLPITPDLTESLQQVVLETEVSFQENSKYLQEKQQLDVRESTDDFTVTNTHYCSLTGTPTYHFTPLAEGHIAQKETMADDSCQSYWTSGQDSVCCSWDQSQDLANNMLFIRQIWSKCPACVTNIYSLWCGFTCDPDQGIFVNVTKTKIKNKSHEVVIGVDFVLSEYFASGLYDSCKDSQINGGVLISDLYVDYDSFLTGFFNQPPNQIDIHFVYRDENSLNYTIEPCINSCSCQNCKPACPEEPAIDPVTEPQCKITMFDAEWDCLVVGLGITYYVVTAVSMIAILFTLPFQIRSLYSGTPREYLCSRPVLGAIVVFVILFLISLVNWLILYLKNDDTITMFDSEWRISTVVCLMIMFGLIYIYLFALAVFVVWKWQQEESTSEFKKSLLYDAEEKMAQPVEELPEGFPVKRTRFHKFFYDHARRITKRPKTVILCCLIFTMLCGLGILNISVQEDPQKLWVKDTSTCATDKKYFDDNFGPFFRVQQIIVKSKNEGEHMLELPILNQLLDIQDIIWNNLTVEHHGKEYSIHDLCYKPVPGEDCIVESALEYWQSDREKLNTYGDPVDWVSACLDDALDDICMSSIGAPNDPYVIFGGFNQTSNNFVNSTVLIVTWLLNNYEENKTIAKLWEDKWLDVVSSEWDRLEIVYYSERSLEDEISREGTATIPTVILSYLLMFAYVSFALGDLPGLNKQLLVSTKFLLGLGGILIVVSSLIISVGLCSAAGVEASLIIGEVIPFLVLAIGVDNIFILVNTYHKFPEHLSIEERIAQTLASVGPSITLASSSEALAFLLGTLTNMPAVIAFALYSSIAIIFDFLFQITAFIALMTIDFKRQEENRVDCVPCIILEEPDVYEDKEQLLPQSGRSERKVSRLKRFFRDYYTPFIMHPNFKLILLFTFFALLFVCIANLVHLPMGLDTSTALPSDSYLLDYFDAVNDYLAVGPPVYIVIRGDYNYTDVDAQNRLCSNPGCDPDSIVNQYDNAPFMAGTTYAWIDDYLSYTIADKCCLNWYAGPGRMNECYNDSQAYCDGCYHLDPYDDNPRPSPEEFMLYLERFLLSDVNDDCKLTGQAYPADIVWADEAQTEIKTTRFRMYHAVLHDQSDYINALNTVYQVADDNPDIDIFPYSVFYIYFEQYLEIVDICALVVGLAMTGVFVVTFLLMGNWLTSCILVAVVSSAITDLLGFMVWWDIELNAVSVVNLVMAIGICIEFCVHIAHAYMEYPGDREQKVHYAMTEMGSSIFSGITITKFLGVSVLALAPSEIFVVYYFRMYMAVVILAATHGLMVLPVVLSLIGPLDGSIWVKHSKYFPCCTEVEIESYVSTIQGDRKIENAED